MIPIDWNTAIQYAALVNIAEGVAPNGEYSQNDTGAIQQAGYGFLQTIYGDDLATDIDPHLGDIVTFGFLAVSPAKELVAAIRGTDTILEWVHDASFLMVPSPIAGAHGLTEDGFTGVYKSLRIGRATGSAGVKDSIKGYLDNGTASSVTVCGHSLGGALATYLTLDVALNTSCRAPVSYTYASPRTGDHGFAGCYNAAVATSYRIVNRLDLVPKLPPILPLPYEHVNTQFELTPPPGKVNDSLVCEHHLTTYLWLMDQFAKTGKWQLAQGCAGTGATASLT